MKVPAPTQKISGERNKHKKFSSYYHWGKERGYLKILITVWHDKKKSFTLREAAKLLGVLSFLAQDCPFLTYLYILLQHPVCKAQKLNSKFILSSKKFTKFLEFTKYRNKEIANFFKSKIVKEVWNFKKKHFITKTMKKETQTLQHILAASNKLNKKYQLGTLSLVIMNAQCWEMHV